MRYFPNMDVRAVSVLCALLFFQLAVKTSYAAEPRTAPNATSRTKVIENVPYRTAATARETRRQSLDLYVPPPAQSKPPLVIFVHGGLWRESDDKLQIGSSLASELSARGAAVALVRYRLGPEIRHPAQAEDVAAAIAYLVRHAEQYGYDPKRLFLAGHSAGAHLVSLVALDERYLAAHRIATRSIAGVVGISGIYDLTGRSGYSTPYHKAIRELFGDDAKMLKDASPIAHVRPGAPPFLLLSGSSDNPGHSIGARRFAEALNGRGNQKTVPMVVSGRNHLTITHFAAIDNPARDLVLNFLKLKPLPDFLADLIAAKRDWLESAPSTLPLWKQRTPILSYPIDRRFLYTLISHYGPLRHELVQWPLAEFHAIDLFAYLDTLPAKGVGQGDYLVTTNLRDEKQFWSRKKIAPYRPVIVVGIDDQRDLFAMSVFYRMQKVYSWKNGPQPPTMARPLGAFIYFLKPPPPELKSQSWHFALTQESFKLEPEDPLASLEDLPRDVHAVMTFRNGCVYCHTFRGTGSRSHHILARGGAAHGGFALPLEDYPPKVWKAFMFDQEAVADKMGAIPNVVEGPARQRLYDLVAQEREKRNAAKR